MKTNYGIMTNEPGVYVLDKIPECGYFEYLYSNPSLYLKVDQFGPSLLQLDPPSGMFAVQRKERETFSPIKFYFKDGNKVVHNFDIYSAKKFQIKYSPNKAEYYLEFNTVSVATTLFVETERPIVHINVSFESAKVKTIKCLSVASFDPVDTAMAIWDKKEWYSLTEVDGLSSPAFITKHFSVNGDKNERRQIVFLQDINALSVQNSLERLRSFTKNFTKLPDKISNNIDSVTCYEQVCATRFNIDVGTTVRSLIEIEDSNNKLNKNELIGRLSSKHEKEELNLLESKYTALISKRTIKTNDEEFNKFVNYYLPLELEWVSNLDRGWPTGMKGSRDCANDFMGFLSYDQVKCKSVLSNLLNNERYDDGWFPRQIPFGNSNKFDLRPFSDSGAFVIEFLYEYLAFTDDFAIFDEEFTYFDKEKKGSGIDHLIKAATYYTLEENIGEHGLIKLHGGDWLDCLNRVGLKGRGESVMVTCQAVLAFNQVIEILKKYNGKYLSEISLFEKKTKQYIQSIEKWAYLKDDEFYKGVFADDGNWYFSNKDIDGQKRIYIPTNAYTIISEINKRNNKKVINSINKYNETKYGFKLFTVPFGNPAFEGIGKMGTGDFQAGMFENGAIYNHGANLFYVRALAKAGDYKTLFRALNYALPYNSKFHPENISYLPSYACTNAYNLVPSFNGRSGMCFLTGSIAMIERSIYNWMLGLDYHLDYLRIKPCLPEQYKNASFIEHYHNHKISVFYHGYGNKVISCFINKKAVAIQDAAAIIDKQSLNQDCEIEITLTK